MDRSHKKMQRMFAIASNKIPSFPSSLSTPYILFFQSTFSFDLRFTHNRPFSVCFDRGEYY
ncbi:hypothetical protein F8388_005508 [Cannabis sativa]|uniref:Uncharacterized protein n=1 Tax=Cannabis sativa TaxID=3483 RepID=A0A7J6GYP9_CANSA|nr:hypothetical protein G4B88_016788 [Cannabis sativa]KAF4387891.1 hypothetical protein F8388_005508 [Cannabis sativa]